MEMNKKTVEQIYNKFLTIIESKLGKGITNTPQLDDVCLKLFGGKYKGAHPCDMQPVLKNKEMCILNLDNSQQSGSHWIGVYKENGKLYVYDSFGRPFKRIIKINSKKVKNTELDSEQGIEQNNCGQRSITSLYMMHSFGAGKVAKYL